MADAPRTGWRHRQGSFLSPVRRFISHGLSKPLLRAAHRRSAPLRLFMGLVVTVVWLFFGISAAIEYGVLNAAPEPAAQSEERHLYPEHPVHPVVRAFANSVCIFRSGKPCDYSEPAAHDGRIFFAQTALALLAIITLLFGFWTQLLGAIAHALRAIGEGHVIVTGKGVEAETLARNAARRGAVVLIRRDVSSAELDAMAADGVAVVAGPPTDAAVLRAAGVSTADRVVAVGTEDAENVGVAAAVHKARRKPLNPGDVLVRVESAELRSYLPSRGRLRAADLFSLSEVAARLLTRSPELLDEAKKRGQDRVHVGVIGWSEDAIAVIARVFRIMWAPDFAPPRITVFVEDEEAARQEFYGRFPSVAQERVWQADIDFVRYNWRGRANPWAGLSAAEAQRGGLTALVVAPPVEGDTALACAASLAQRATPQSIPIYVRENNDGSIGVSLASEDGARVIAFGAPSDVLSSEALIERSLDNAAMSLHEVYLDTVVLDQNKDEYERALRKHGDGASIEELEKRINAGALASLRKRLADSLLARGKFTPDPARPAQARWGQLPEHYISINRTAADHAVMKMWAMGWSPAPKGKSGTLPKFDASQINDQDSAIEHQRWAADLLLSGWRSGPRDELEMTHTDLIPYSEFPPEKLQAAKDKDRYPWLEAPRVAAFIYPRKFVERAKSP